MADQTAFERAKLVVRGDRAELRVEGGRVTIDKQAPTRDAPTTVEFGVDEVRGTQIQAPSRGARGWLHIGVVGGSPAPPGELAAAGDPYTLPLSSRSMGSARRLAKLVDRHVRERGMPHEPAPTEGRISAGVSITRAPATEPRTVVSAPPSLTASPEESRDGSLPAGSAPGSVDRERLVAELQALADLRASGALSDDEFERAKARVLG